MYESGSRIYASYLHTGAATGRVTVCRPSLQNLMHPITLNVRTTKLKTALASLLEQVSAKDSAVVREVSQTADQVTFQISVRDAIVAAPGKVLVSADYNQIELRILAHLSKDPGLIAVFQPVRVRWWLAPSACECSGLVVSYRATGHTHIFFSLTIRKLTCWVLVGS